MRRWSPPNERQFALLGRLTDVAFYNMLYYNTCPAYFWKSACRSTAYTYYVGVFYGGHPKNGADAT
ncbi:hypothetical protein [Streptomyces litmocidini]|uniref:hypothetical protein n=1 Tax=Streptomyces litmocidini TaxID=67318 RepID=UPI0036FAA709